MRDRMERFVVLPFSVGCISEASVAVSVQQPRRSKPVTNLSAIRSKEEDDLENLSSESMKNSFANQRPNITTGFNRLFKGFKNFSSQLFVYKEDMEELEMEMEMEIGCPTDVKHVTHIGWDVDGSESTANPMMGWDNLIPPEFRSLSSANSFKQFEFSMPGAEAAADASALVNGSSS